MIGGGGCWVGEVLVEVNGDVVMGNGGGRLGNVWLSGGRKYGLHEYKSFVTK